MLPIIGKKAWNSTPNMAKHYMNDINIYYILLMNGNNCILMFEFLKFNIHTTKNINVTEIFYD